MIEKIIESHERDREVYLASMRTMSEKLETIAKDVKKIQEDIEDLK